jgi:hypothetical protein
VGSRKGDMERKASGRGRGIGIDCKGAEDNKLDCSHFDGFLLAIFLYFFHFS